MEREARLRKSAQRCPFLFLSRGSALPAVSSSLSLTFSARVRGRLRRLRTTYVCGKGRRGGERTRKEERAAVERAAMGSLGLSP
jgi:hypothetical protein